MQTPSGSVILNLIL
jgi:calcium-dependent protein kinase